MKPSEIPKEATALLLQRTLTDIGIDPETVDVYWEMDEVEVVVRVTAPFALLRYRHRQRLGLQQWEMVLEQITPWSEVTPALSTTIQHEGGGNEFWSSIKLSINGWDVESSSSHEDRGLFRFAGAVVRRSSEAKR